VPRLPFPARLLSPSIARVLLAALVLAGLPVAAAPQADELAAKAQQGKEAMAAGRFDEAATLYGAIVQALPNEPGMRLNLGMALSMAGRLPEAIPHLQTALKLRPDLLPASLFLGVAYAELRQPAKAVEPLQRFVAAQPDHSEARQMLADALLTLDRWEPAARHYRALTQQAPDDPKAWYGLDRAYEGLSRRAFETLQQTAPESPYLSLLVAEAMVAQERDKSAFPLLREAIAKRTRPAEAHEALAGIYGDRPPDWRCRARQGEGDPAARLPDGEHGVRLRAGRYQEVLTRRGARTATL
jgi:tetratricopeptide (TPR) repeat protein